MTNEKQTIIEYRLREARETLEDAEMLLENDRLRSAANRIYYGMFYAAIALLATRDLKSSHHSGVITLLADSFVRTGILPKEIYRHLGRAFDLRTQGDYKDMVVLRKPALQEMLADAKVFVAKVEELIVAPPTKPDDTAV